MQSKFDSTVPAAAGCPEEDILGTPFVLGAATKEDAKLPDEAIAGLLYAGQVGLVGGGSKSKKTWLLVQCAVAMAAGSKWLAWDTTTPRRVLFVNLELQKPFLISRFHGVLRAMEVRGQEVPNRITVWQLRGKPVKMQSLVDELIRYCRTAAEAGEPFGAIIIDPLYRLWAGEADENDNSQIGEMLFHLERIAERTACGVLATHHFSKGNQAAKESIDRFSGAGSFGRAPDSLITFTPHSEEDVLTVETTLRNHKPVEPFCVRWEFPIFTTNRRLNPADLKRPGRERIYSDEDLLDALEAVQPATYRTWLSELEERGVGIKKPTLERRAADLRGAGTIEKHHDKNGALLGWALVNAKNAVDAGQAVRLNSPS